MLLLALAQLVIRMVFMEKAVALIPMQLLADTFESMEAVRVQELADTFLPRATVQVQNMGYIVW